MIRVATFASRTMPVTAFVALVLAIGLVAPAAAASRQSLRSAHAPARHAAAPIYDTAPQGQHAVNSDDPSLTGGGSLGYNQNIYNW